MVTDIAAGTSKVILASSDASYNLRYCNWKSETRLICQLGAFKMVDGFREGFSRTIAVSADGTNPIELGPHADSRDLSTLNSSGYVIDWLPDDPKHVLMQVYVPERDNAGTNITKGYGMSVQSVDVDNARMATFQQPKQQALQFDTDDRGSVRYMVTGSRDSDGYVRDNAVMAAKAKGSSTWTTIGKTQLSGLPDIEYHGFDESGDAVLTGRRVDGRMALYRTAIDGAQTGELVFAHPRVDVDSVLRIGKFSRPVAAGYVLDMREWSYFDPILSKRHAALSNALPGKPPIAIVDESWDARYNLIAAGGVTDPGTYYRFDTQAKQLGALLPLRPQMAAYKTAPQTSISYPAADGTQIPAYMTLPPGGATKGLPAVIMPHGGPSSRDQLGFDWLSQFYAQLGYVVLQPNYRGSAGYGADWYQKNGFKSWKTAIGDVNAGAHWLIAQGIADPKRMTAVGWSYGGYAVLQANVVEPGLYKAIVAIAPVTNLELLRDKARFSGDYQLIINEVGIGDHVIQGSPARNAAAITAPVLMFQGDKDLNVDPEQARTMDAALASAHKKHQLVMYPGLDHQLADSNARADMLAKSAAWLADTIGH